MREMKTVDAAIVYTFRGDHWVAFIGGDSNFKTKEDIFRSGEEVEVFTVSRPSGTPISEIVREVNARAYEQRIPKLYGITVTVIPVAGEA